MSAHSPKRGDWRPASPVRWSWPAEAVAERDSIQQANPGARLRIRSSATLGYTVEVFVPRPIRGETA